MRVAYGSYWGVATSARMRCGHLPGCRQALWGMTILSLPASCLGTASAALGLSRCAYFLLCQMSRDGKTPIESAKEEGHTAVVQFLLGSAVAVRVVVG